MKQQPTFWLEVRKDYVIDNYDSLLPYLRGYHYDELLEEKDSDFNKTFRCLKEVIYDIRQSIDNDTIYSHAAKEWDSQTLKKNVGLMAAYLLAAQKKRLNDNATLSALCDILLTIEKTPDVGLLQNMLHVAQCCTANWTVVTYGFTWDDVESIPQFSSLSLFCQKISKTVFRNPNDDDDYKYLEGKGLLVVGNTNMALVPMNKADYDKSDLQPQISLPIGLDILVPKLEKTNKTDFPELIDTCGDILRSLDNITPSIKKELKTYEFGDELTVRIKSNKYGYVDCESIDPNYVKTNGLVFIPFKLFNYFQDSFTVTKESITSNLRIGDTLKVRRQDNEHCPFILDSKIVKDFVAASIGDMEPHACDAVHVQSYGNGAGHRWLTDNGILVNILGKPTEQTQKSIDNDLPVRIRISESKKDKSGNWVVNGKYAYNEQTEFDGTYEEFMIVARDNFVDALLDYYYIAPEDIIPPKKATEASDTALPLLINILYRSSQITGDTVLRYKSLFATRFLATIISEAQDSAFLRQQMRYQECLVHFALGDETASTLKLRDDNDLPQLETIDNEKEIIGQLSKYQDMNVERLRLTPGHDIDTNYLAEMIGASNVLRGKLEPAEMNRIKKSIADYLGVADVYRNINRDYTDYGDESDTLEFKTSIVFPPNNNMKPDLFAQKWAILRAVCGFLNTVTGGEILLGVNDNGVACGLGNDMQYLYTRHFIGSQTMDSYRRYVKNIIDNAFIDDHKVAGLDITSPRISYVIEHSNEGDELLRIQVHPYEYGIVSFKDDYLPEGTARSYYRTSGASVKMDEKLMQQVRAKKKLSKVKN